MNKKRNRNRKSKRKFTATVSKPKNDIFSKWQGNTIPMLGYNYKIDKLKNDSKINTDVLYTQDYSKFKLMEDNRDVDDSHVAELVEKNEIIDGQRRFTSCKILGIPVMYLVSYKTTIKDVLLINTSQKSWNRHDYLKAYSHNNHWNHAEYRKISTFLKTYSLKFDIALFLLYGQPIQHSAGKGLKDFKMGDFKVENLEGAQRHANQLMKIKAFAPNLVDIGKFCKAFLKVSLIDDFSYVVAYKQLEKNTKKFDKCQNQEDWDEAMVKAYNFDLKRPNKRISIKKDGF